VNIVDIESTQNKRIKHVVKLRKRSFRDDERELLIEGYRECLRGYEAEHAMHALFMCPALFLGANEETLIRDIHDRGATIYECSEEAFRKISYRDRPDGLLALGAYRDTDLANFPVAENGLYLIAESVEKPGNLGTLLRSADAAGVTGLILCDPQTDLHNPNVVRASVGTLFTVPVATATREQTLQWLRENGIKYAATTPDTDTLHWDADLTGPLALAVGAEQYGLTDEMLDGADIVLRISMHGKADSLNVATSATVVLYEALRQRAQQSAD